MSHSELAQATRRQNVRYARAQVEENRRQRRLAWQAEAKLLWEKWHTDPLFLLGIGLYWGEGHKSPLVQVLRLSNSDLRLLRTWMGWCQRFLPGVPLRYELNLHSNCDADAARRFWEDQLGIQIAYTWVAISSASKQKRKTLPNGTLNIRVGRGSLEWYTKMMVWLELAHDLPFAVEAEAPTHSGASQ